MELSIPEKSNDSCKVIQKVFEHVFEDDIVSISESGDGEMILVSTLSTIYTLIKSECLNSNCAIKEEIVVPHHKQVFRFQGSHIYL